MASILLAGGPGSGKSSVSHQLRDRNLHSVDLDFGFARWEDGLGSPVTFPHSPSLTWLDHHHWQWDDMLLSELLSACADRTAVLCGTAFNMFGYLDRFDLLLLLKIDDATLEARLGDPGRNNVFGTTGDTVAWSRSWRHRVETELLARGAQVIDATEPLERVVEATVAAGTAYGFPIDTC